MTPSTLRPKVKSETPTLQSEETNLPPTLRPKKNIQQESIKEEPIENVVYPYEEENDLEREIERNIAQQTSRGLEAIAGLPGDLLDFVFKLSGKEEGQKLFPTSQSLRKKSEELSLGYTKPKNEHEEKAGELIQDVAGMLLPGAGKYNLARNIGIPVVANLVKEGLNYGGKEKLGTAAKVGTMIVLDVLSHRSGGAKKHISDLYNQSESLIPKGEKLLSPNLEKSVGNLENVLKSGGSSPSKEKALNKLTEIKSKMKNGEIEVQELIDFRKSINELKTELGGWEVQLPKPLKKKAIANLDKVNREVIHGLEEYGKKNPEFGKLNRSANEAYAAFEQSKKISDFITKTSKRVFKSDAAKAILGYGVYSNPGVIKGSLLAAGPALLANETYKILHRVIKSPTLRKYYGNILKGASIGNATQVVKNIELLDNELYNQENKNQ